MKRRGTSRRVMKLLTIASGLAAVIWAMRDRLISVPNEREETPPSFRASNGQKADST